MTTTGYNRSASFATTGQRTARRRAGQTALLVLTLLFGAMSGGYALAEEPPVNINTATAEELSAALTGVGLAKAKRIIEYREAHGPFEHADELAEVTGIGDSTVERNRARITLE